MRTRLSRQVRAHDAPELRLDSQSRSENGDAADRPASRHDLNLALTINEGFRPDLRRACQADKPVSSRLSARSRLRAAAS